MKIAALITCALALVACAGEPLDEETAGEGDVTDESDMTKSRFTSAFTSLEAKDCKTVEEGEGFSRQECAGAAGYKLVVEDGDLRTTVQVVGPKSKDVLDVSKSIGDGGGFSSLGPKAEWRSVDAPKAKPFALIYRHIDEAKKRNYLVVAKLEESRTCVVAVVDANKPDGNVRARQAAEAHQSKPCPQKAPAVQ